MAERPVLEAFTVDGYGMTDPWPVEIGCRGCGWTKRLLGATLADLVDAAVAHVPHCSHATYASVGNPDQPC